MSSRSRSDAASRPSNARGDREHVVCPLEACSIWLASGPSLSRSEPRFGCIHYLLRGADLPDDDAIVRLSTDRTAARYTFDARCPMPTARRLRRPAVGVVIAPLCTASMRRRQPCCGDASTRWRDVEARRHDGLDAEGRRLVPGFNDAHVRFVDGGRDLDDVDLRDADSAAEFARRINERAKAKPGEWILGGRWDHRRWSPAALPTRALYRRDHQLFPGVRGQRRRPDGARQRCRARTRWHYRTTPIPRAARGPRRERLSRPACCRTRRWSRRAGDPAGDAGAAAASVKRALEHAESLGITSVQDVGAAYEDIGVFADLANRSELTVRIYAMTRKAAGTIKRSSASVAAFGSPWLRIGAVRARRLRRVRRRDPHAADGGDHAGLQAVRRSVAAAVPTFAGLDLLDDIARGTAERDRRFASTAAHVRSRTLIAWHPRTS